MNGKKLLRLNSIPDIYIEFLEVLQIASMVWKGINPNTCKLTMSAMCSDRHSNIQNQQKTHDIILPIIKKNELVIIKKLKFSLKYSAANTFAICSIFWLF